MGVRLLARSMVTSPADLVTRVERLGSKPPQSNRWRVQCAFMLPRSAGRREIFVLQTSEMPNAQLIVLHEPLPEASGEGSNGNAVRVVRSGPEDAPALELAQTHTQRLKIQIEGSVLLCGDFIVRVGQLTLNTTLSGTVMEVEYLPCAVANAPAAPLKAIADLLLPADERDFCSSETECFRDAVGLPARFSLEHSTLLLVGLMRSRLGVQEYPASKHAK